MSKPSASSNHLYQVIRELESNQEQSQVLYLAKNKATEQLVILTRFIFAQSGFNQSAYEAYQQEIQGLKGLNHPGIPRYLDSFTTTDSFCLVQEYKDAQSLAQSRHFTLNEIKTIAVSVLEILVYLHNHTPPVIHRNIKPENVLVDDQLNVSLVDFGLPIMRGQVGFDCGSGTLGFKAPEQLYHRKITEATDLYHLGVTLICLLTQTKSTEIYTLIDKQDRINFQHLVPTSLSLGFINWLDTMVQPNRKERYPSAAAALEALKTIDLARLPEVKFTPSSLNIKATNFGEKLTQLITIKNSVPDTVLKGTWKVALHPHDPLCHPGSHAWISFEPSKFESNYAKCEITVDTSKLRSKTTYKRQIVLNTNTSPNTHSLTLQVQTAAIETKKLPLVSLIILFVMAAVGGWLETWAIGGFSILGWGFLSVGLALGSVDGLALMFSNTDLFFSTSLITLSVGMGFAIFVGIGTIEVGLVGYLVGFFIGFLVAVITGNLVKKHRKRGFSGLLAIGITITTAALGMCLGIGFKLGFLNLFLKLALAGTGFLLVMMIGWSLLRQAISIFKYQRSERYLIKP